MTAAAASCAVVFGGFSGRDSRAGLHAPSSRPILALREGGGRWVGWCRAAVPRGSRAGGEELPGPRWGLLFAGTEPLNCCWGPPRRPPASTCGEGWMRPGPWEGRGGLVGAGGAGVGLGSRQPPSSQEGGPTPGVPRGSVRRLRRSRPPSLRTRPRGHSERPAGARSHGPGGEPSGHLPFPSLPPPSSAPVL